MITMHEIAAPDAGTPRREALPGAQSAHARLMFFVPVNSLVFVVTPTEGRGSRCHGATQSRCVLDTTAKGDGSDGRTEDRHE
ncbi:MAG: hypothetical protein HYV63_15675 [Candidatus Schekmanbacteria bacterium]|nr:hypothetical protein [Candidatus Schekmanbacteria bacterium]